MSQISRITKRPIPPRDRLPDLASSANDILRVGAIGTGGRSKYLIGNLPESGHVTAICDCAMSPMAGTMEAKRVFATALQRFHITDAAACVTYQDYRECSIGSSSMRSFIAKTDE